MRLGLYLAAALVSAIGAHGARAADWPDKPVRLVVPFDPGGSADLISRRIADELSKKFGQQFFVDNRPGGGGLLAARIVAHTPPDGYTLIESGMSSFVIAPAVTQDAGFDPVRDFTHVAFIGGAPSVLLVNPSLGVKDFGALLARMGKPGEGFSYASAGVGTVGNIVAEYIARKKGLNLAHVPYRAGGAALLDLLAGRVNMGAMNWTTVQEYVRDRKLIALAVSSRRRVHDAPDVPTLTELGFPDLATTTWQAISAPKGLDPRIAQRLNDAVKDALKRPDLAQQLAADGVETEDMSVDELGTFVAGEVTKWSPILAASVKRD
jgi:tripartite-type tricarboxylate transporter receptor subunit TctC